MFLDRHLPISPPLAVTGIIHQDVDLNALRLQRLEQPLRRIGFFQIGGDRPRFDSVGVFQLPGDLNQLRFHWSDEDDRMLMACEFIRQMKANAAGGAGDECSFFAHAESSPDGQKRICRLGKESILPVTKREPSTDSKTPLGNREDIQ